MASAVVVGCFLTLVVAVRATHPRDEADFLLAARTGSTLIDLDDQTLVDEGDQACRWLSQQERALWNHGVWFNRDDALGRYVRETRPSTLGVWGTPGQWRESRVDVADAAWSQLCGGTWWWHRPHGPSLSPRSNEYDGD